MAGVQAGSGARFAGQVALVTGAASGIDRQRFTPGFEKRLSGRALFGVYTALALGLPVGSLCNGRG